MESSDYKRKRKTNTMPDFYHAQTSESWNLHKCRGSAMFVMGNSLERGLNRNCNDTRKTISAAFGAG
jgi:hypothetical protein